MKSVVKISATNITLADTEESMIKQGKWKTGKQLKGLLRFVFFIKTFLSVISYKSQNSFTSFFCFSLVFTDISTTDFIGFPYCLKIAFCLMWNIIDV